MTNWHQRLKKDIAHKDEHRDLLTHILIMWRYTAWHDMRHPPFAEVNPEQTVSLTLLHKDGLGQDSSDTADDVQQPSLACTLLFIMAETTTKLPCECNSIHVTKFPNAATTPSKEFQITAVLICIHILQMLLVGCHAPTLAQHCTFSFCSLSISLLRIHMPASSVALL